MSIEDVDYLKKNSVENHYVFFSDSAHRDRIAYPTPSSYVISFIEPFKNVYGLEIIDSSIPRTEYIIENYNNKLTFSINGRPFKSIFLDIGNPSSVTLKADINEKCYDDIDGQNVYIKCEDVSSPPEVRGTYQFSCVLPFVFDMTSSTISEIIGFDTFANPSEFTKYDYIEQSVLNNINYRLFGSLNGFLEPNNIYSGPTTVLPNKLFPIFNTRFIAQKFFTNVQCVFAQVLLTVGSYNGYQPIDGGPNQNIQWELWTDNDILDQPGSKITEGDLFVSYINGNLSESEILSTNDVTPGSVQKSLFQGILNKNVVLDIHKFYWIIFKYNSKTFSNLETDETYGIYYDNTYPSGALISDENICKTSINGGNTWQNISSTENNAINCGISVYPINYIITAPNLYSLIGVRYLLFRCQEIDDNLFQSKAIGATSLGLAKFKVGANGFSDDRFDFSNVIIKPFHPIGKVPRLTISFVKSNGELYDFKGVNHTITFVIRYYTPAPTVEFSKSLLNPNYNANYMLYINNKYSNQKNINKGNPDDVDDDQYTVKYKEDEDTGIDNINEGYDESETEDDYDSNDSDDDDTESSDSDIEKFNINRRCNPCRN
jgi:hypothetical protein